LKCLDRQDVPYKYQYILSTPIPDVSHEDRVQLAAGLTFTLGRGSRRLAAGELSRGTLSLWSPFCRTRVARATARV